MVGISWRAFYPNRARSQKRMRSPSLPPCPTTPCPPQWGWRAIFPRNSFRAPGFAWVLGPVEPSPARSGSVGSVSAHLLKLSGELAPPQEKTDEVPCYACDPRADLGGVDAFVDRVLVRQFEFRKSQSSSAIAKRRGKSARWRCVHRRLGDNWCKNLVRFTDSAGRG